jgi:hypothetical protein
LSLNPLQQPPAQTGSIYMAQSLFLLLLLLLLLQYGGPAAQEAAAAAIENLSLDSDCEAALAAEGAIEGLLQVLKDGSTAAQVSRKDCRVYCT